MCWREPECIRIIQFMPFFNIYWRRLDLVYTWQLRYYFVTNFTKSLPLFYDRCFRQKSTVNLGFVHSLLFHNSFINLAHIPCDIVVIILTNFTFYRIEFTIGNIKIEFIFYIIPQHQDGQGSENTSLWMTGTCSACTVNTMFAEHLATQGARALI